MKTYAELFQEIQTFPYSDEMFDLYKDSVQLEFIEIYINNQLYIRENFDNTNQILMESLDEDRLNKVIMEAEEKSESWFKKLGDRIIIFFQWILKWLKRFYKFLTSKNREENVKKAIQDIEVLPLPPGPEPIQLQLNAANINIPIDSSFIEAGETKDAAFTAVKITAGLGYLAALAAAKKTKELASVSALFFVNLASNLKNANARKKSLEIDLIKISHKIGETTASVDYNNIVNEINNQTGKLGGDIKSILTSVLNFNDVTYHFITKKDNVNIITLEDFNNAFNNLNANDGKGTEGLAGTYQFKFMNNLNSKISKAIEKYSKQSSRYDLKIESVKSFEEIIKNLHKVLKNLEVDNKNNKFNYVGFEDPTKLKTKIFGKVEENRKGIDNKLTGTVSGRTGESSVRETENTKTHFVHDLAQIRNGHFKFYSMFSKASANLLRAMQVAQETSNIVLNTLANLYKIDRSKKVNDELTPMN